ncbi:MAG TPA: xanthine dehydrogenase family protein molybdopterin-binding subunit [Streptosporangiaceae bacterium]
MLHVKLITVDCAHARIQRIDTEQARARPGVRAVVSAADLPNPMPRFGPVYQDRPVLALGETRFHGEPVAAVVAETEQAAEEAAALVEVHYEELPAVATVAAALDPSAPLVQDPELRTGPHSRTNLLREWRFGWGEAEAAVADHVLDNTYTFPMVTHFAIEPHCFLAAPDHDGVTVWSAVQHPFVLQEMIARLLDLPLAKVRVHAPDPGGAFGGKQHAKYEPLLALLAVRLRCPVRLELTLDETFQAVRRTAFEIRLRSGFASDGTLCFQDAECNALLGAYADIGPRVVAKACYLMCGPYRVPQARIHARALLSHTPPATAFRGFGTPQVAWALESQMDEAARRLGLDRLEIRLKNLARPGEQFIPGDKAADGDWPGSLRRAAEEIGWGTPMAPGRGRGIAVGVKASATTGASYAIVRLHFDGSATVLAATSDMGQGARTVLAQVAAQELGIGVDQVRIVMGDTAIVPFDLQTSASRSVVFMGTAVLEACRDIHAKLQVMACETFGLSPESVQITPGTVRVPARKLAFAELMSEAFAGVRGELIGVGSRRGERVGTHPLGGPPAFYEFSCTACEVEVDRETGEMLIVKHISVADVGKALNPAQAESQDEGAAIMGLGHSLMEHLILDERGRILNLGALDYRVPTTKDVPLEMRSLLVENGDGPGPYGSKGAGEGGLFAVAPAIAGAVADATGAVIRQLPLTPERIWAAMTQQAAAHRSR